MTTQATNIAELKTYGASMSDGDSLEILGYSTAGDGGGGTFYWDATSTDTDNVGTIIKATGVTTGRWKRVYSGSLNVLWYGADPTNTLDSIVALEAARDHANSLYERVIQNDAGTWIGATWPAKVKEVFFPAGSYKISRTFVIAGGYAFARYRGEGEATLAYTGAGIALDVSVTDVGSPLITQPLYISNINVRKMTNPKSVGSIGLNVERYTNATFKGIGVYGFDIGVLHSGGIDNTFDFDNSAVDTCNYGFVSEEKSPAAGGKMKPNLTHLSNAYFIACSKHAIWCRRNTDDVEAGNSTGSVYVFENINFQSSSEVAMNLEYLGEPTGTGNAMINNCWFEGSGPRMLRLDHSRASMNNCFMYNLDGTGEASIALDDQSTLNMTDCEFFLSVTPLNSYMVHILTNTTAYNAADRYASDTFSTSGVFDRITTMNTVKQGVSGGLTSYIYLGQNAISGGRIVPSGSYGLIKAANIYTANHTTASLATSATEVVFNTGDYAGMWQVTVRESGGNIAWRNSSEVWTNGAGTASSVTTSASANVTVTITGKEIIVTNTNASAVSLYASILKLN